MSPSVNDQLDEAVRGLVFSCTYDYTASLEEATTLQTHGQCLVHYPDAHALPIDRDRFAELLDLQVSPHHALLEVLFEDGNYDFFLPQDRGLGTEEGYDEYAGYTDAPSTPDQRRQWDPTQWKPETANYFYVTPGLNTYAARYPEFVPLAWGAAQRVTSPHSSQFKAILLDTDRPDLIPALRASIREDPQLINSVWDLSLHLRPGSPQQKAIQTMLQEVGGIPGPNGRPVLL